MLSSKALCTVLGLLLLLFLSSWFFALLPILAALPVLLSLWVSVAIWVSWSSVCWSFTASLCSLLSSPVGIQASCSAIWVLCGFLVLLLVYRVELRLVTRSHSSSRVCRCLYGIWSSFLAEMFSPNHASLLISEFRAFLWCVHSMALLSDLLSSCSRLRSLYVVSTGLPWLMLPSDNLGFSQLVLLPVRILPLIVPMLTASTGSSVGLPVLCVFHYEVLIRFPCHAVKAVQVVTCGSGYPSCDCWLLLVRWLLDASACM